jgi:hypothetical protein
MDPECHFPRDWAACSNHQNCGALADPQRRATLLRESCALLDGLPGSVKALASTRVWSDRVRIASAG